MNTNVSILNIDCIEYMRDIDDDFFDISIVDPPFGIFGDGKKKGSHFAWKKEGTGGGWESKYGTKCKEWDFAPEQVYFDELKRVSRDQIIWGANHFGIKTDNYVVWLKETISETFTMGMCEFASVTCKGNPKVFKHRPQDPSRFHPTQKPVALYKWLLSKYAKPGQRILDTHLGSGSSAIAAHYYGCDFVGCEIDKDYFDKATARFYRETRQIDMIGY